MTVNRPGAKRAARKPDERCANCIQYRPHSRIKGFGTCVHDWPLFLYPKYVLSSERCPKFAPPPTPTEPLTAARSER